MCLFWKNKTSNKKRILYFLLLTSKLLFKIPVQFYRKLAKFCFIFRNFYFKKYSGKLKDMLGLIYSASVHSKLCVCVCARYSLSHVRLFVTPWTVACQAPLSVEFSRIVKWVAISLLTKHDCLFQDLLSSHGSVGYKIYALEVTEINK